MIRKQFRPLFCVAFFSSFLLSLSASAQRVDEDARLRAPAQGETELPVPANPNLPTLFLIGDSTIRNGRGDGANGQWGWGEPLVDYFDPAKLNVVNRALGGRSSRTYLTQGHWDLVRAMLKRGDFVMMQFGHNDSGPLDDTARARGTLPGAGDETREIDNPITKQHEVVHTYGWYMEKFIADTRAAGATPIVCSPIPRKIWINGKVVRSLDYGKWAADVAASEGALFVDLNEIIARKYEELGPDKVEPLFRDPQTHTGLVGAELNAECVIEGLKGLANDPLETYYSRAALGDYKLWQAIVPATTLFKFDLGAGGPTPGYIKVTSGDAYSDQLGYGFESAITVPARNDGGASAITNEPPKENYFAGDKPFYFSVKVPQEGNYRVTVTLGNSRAEATTTVKTELRRLTLSRVHTDPGKFEIRSFLVNIRSTHISSTEEVQLKDREKGFEARAWDDKLTLEFVGDNPSVSLVEIEKDNTVPTLYIAGDSTSTDQPVEPYNSWGQMLPVFFMPEIAVANHGESGESLRGFINENRLDKLDKIMRPGDWLFIEMGHNDQKEKGEGVGAFTTYKADLKRFVAVARNHGATPVLITSVSRMTFDPSGKITNSLGDYPEAVRQIAREDNVALIDLQTMSAEFYEALGPDNAHKAFANSSEHTHHNDYGSYELAKCIGQGIKDDRLPLAKYLYPVPTFDPAKPDRVDVFDIPAEPMPIIVSKPYGH